MHDSFETSGRIWLRGALDAATLTHLDQACAAMAQASVRLDATSHLTEVLGPDGPVSRAIASLLPSAFPTRVVAFDKSANHNWGVPWHQDRVIRVADKVETAHATNWSLKAGAWHCEPPLDILQNMLFVRLHLDDDTPASGPMQIALGSHSLGKVAAQDATDQAKRHHIETCFGKRGDILVSKMLTLHRSSAATEATTRRVLRVDYANRPLPAPLAWAL